MAIAGLTIIAESINDSVPSTKALFEAEDLEGIRSLARLQDEKGAAYIDVNVGSRTPEFMAEVVRQVQSVTTKPLSIDTPDPATAEAGLAAYDPARAGGALPILNSISMLRMSMLDLYRIQPFNPILIISERMEHGVARPNRTSEETYATAHEMLSLVKNSPHHIPEHQCIFDPGIAPLGSDTEGYTRALMDSLKLMKADPAFSLCHRSVGLSNFTVMLPAKRADGTPVKGPLESAFLTRAMPLGLDMVIGSVNRNYQSLPDDHPAMKCFDDVLSLDGYDIIMRVQEFYAV
ncbi:MAG: dihydropteroate synthase [Chitinispirillaceae bacterium]|jgi:cobalamin-dependent methionine synthase I|nr:dihydropteroate synthase [Chitinispirillaceae bacterium]